jgi:hypothetical protein
MPAIRAPIDYNGTTTQGALICQFTKNVHVISAVLALGYEKVKIV